MARTEANEDLLGALAGGDRRTRNAACVRLEPLIAGTLRRVLGPCEDHDDLVQAAFEQLTLTLATGTFEGACNLTSWAVTVTRHLALNAIRNRRRQRRVFDRRVGTDRLPEARASGSDPEAIVGAREALDRARTLLATMPPGRAHALMLHGGMGYDLSEISVLSGASVTAAQSRLVRARRELRRRMAMDGLT